MCVYRQLTLSVGYEFIVLNVYVMVEKEAASIDCKTTRFRVALYRLNRRTELYGW